MAGHQKISASGVLGTSGKPIKLFGYSQSSAATGPGLVILYNGTDATGTELFRQTGVANGTVQVSFGGAGKFFPAGLFASIDGDVSYLDFDYEQTQS